MNRSGATVVAAGDSAVFVEFDERIDPAVNARAIALASALHGAAIRGVRDVVPTYRSVAIYFDPLRTAYDQVVACIQQQLRDPAPAPSASRPPLRIPVCYGGELGPDLVDVAAFARTTPDDVVRRHTAVTYRVFMLGFVAGFAYLGSVDEAIAMPRRPTPRVRVPVGSVGIAGGQTGIYPAETPGGWQLIGRTPVKPFDPRRDPPFLLAAGDHVQFYAIDRDTFARLDRDASEAPEARAPVERRVADGELTRVSRAALRVIKPGMLTTVQDAGRWGYQSRGVPVAGPMDPSSHRIANALVGNARDAAALEVTLLGPELEFEDERVVAIAGADFDITLDDRRVPMHAPFVASAGAHLKFGVRRRGARAYVGIAGGIATPPVLGSRATHVVSGMGGIGGRALRAGDVLPLFDARRLQPAGAPLPPVLTLPEGHARVRVMAGPQQESFATGALDALQSAPYAIRQDSDRMGFRLQGPTLAHARGADIISDATPLGVLQVPASGHPILLMADRQTTGGYPKIATVIAADIPVAGQLAPGDTIQFVVCTPQEAMAALIAQERALMALEPHAS